MHRQYNLWNRYFKSGALDHMWGCDAYLTLIVIYMATLTQSVRQAGRNHIPCQDNALRTEIMLVSINVLVRFDTNFPGRYLSYKNWVKSKNTKWKCL